MRNRWAPAVLVLTVAAAAPAHAGHEAPLYPSYYPQEIEIQTVDPAAAARLLDGGKIHAYVGASAAFAGPPPQSVLHAGSLGSYLILRVNPASSAAKDETASCAAAASALKTLAADAQGFVPHPYPVNAYHADFLHHADRAAAARARFLDATAPPAALRVRAQGALADNAVRGRFAPAGTDWDVAVEQVDAAAIVAPHRFAVAGWMGPPWLKAGWFHAYLLLAPSLADASLRERAAALVARLQGGASEIAAARVNIERELVALLTRGCRAVVAGYAVKRESYSNAYSEGIENIAWDSHAGLNSAIFLRAVKLKDFPWNGWLRLGVPAGPKAAWNPLGGFNDEAGRLIWSALGDPALFPDPYSGGWMLNRIGDVRPAGR